MAVSCWLLCFRGRAEIANTLVSTRPHQALLLFAQFLLGVYGGYFGGAVGIMMMAVWSLFGTHDVKLMNPAKVLLVAAANTIAVACFLAGGMIAWQPTATMLIAAALGGSWGARLTLILNSSQLRVAVTARTCTSSSVIFTEPQTQ
jgi:uncharacterized protein